MVICIYIVYMFCEKYMDIRVFIYIPMHTPQSIDSAGNLFSWHGYGDRALCKSFNCYGNLLCNAQDSLAPDLDVNSNVGSNHDSNVGSDVQLQPSVPFLGSFPDVHPHNKSVRAAIAKWFPRRIHPVELIP